MTEAQFNEGDEQFGMTIEAENDNFSKDDGDDQAEHELNRSTQSEQMENPSRYQGRLRSKNNNASVDNARVSKVNNPVQLNVHKGRNNAQDFYETDWVKESGPEPEEVHHTTAYHDIEDRICQEIIGETVAKTMKQLMMEGRLIMDGEVMSNRPVQSKFNKGTQVMQNNAKSVTVAGGSCKSNMHLSISDLTIYDRAVKDATNELHKRVSSSSEEADTSNETIMLNAPFDMSVYDPVDGQNNNARFNSVPEPRYNPEEDIHTKSPLQRLEQEHPQPGPSGYKPPGDSPNKETGNNPEAIADDIVRDAELVRIFDIPGKNSDIPQEFIHSMMVDENYCSVVAHIDATLRSKIIQGHYVDFTKLVLRDWVLTEEDNRIHLVMKGGGTFFVPANDCSTNITNVHKWDQAFRVFSDIYCQAHPARSTELIYYSHVIHTAASGYIWDNVYSYDKDFRIHLAQNPRRSWAIILQQAWSMRLRDRLRYHEQNEPTGGGSSDKGKVNPKDFCCRFNKGRCTFGLKCRYPHRCSYCLKHGHGLFNCRKLIADRKEKESVTGVQETIATAEPLRSK